MHVATKKYHKENQYFFDPAILLYYNFAGFSQEKITSEFVRYSQFCPNLASMMVKEVLPSYDG